ncbi:MAG: nucleotidyltransferase domain-containing protein [Chloroflexota bacterium]
MNSFSKVQREDVQSSNVEPELRAIGDRYKVAALYVFGSRAAEIAGRVRGRVVSSCYPESDVDIGVQLASGHRLSARDRVRLAIELEDLLGVQRVDLVVLPEADPFLALDIIRGGVALLHRCGRAGRG